VKLRTVLSAVAVLLLAAFLAEMAGLVSFGDPPSPAMDGYFLARAQEETGANNVVTSIVFDYRGFDTLGEACVLFTAVLGVSLALRKRDRQSEIAPPAEEEEA
jgi:multisubunit Na+/H+ antiporter MnhB subunit